MQELEPDCKSREAKAKQAKAPCKAKRAAETAPDRWITPLNACKTDTERLRLRARQNPDSLVERVRKAKPSQSLLT